MKKITKTIAGVLGLAIALSLVVVASATPASADTTAAATAAVTFTRSLTIGSSGADVTALQTWLISAGYSIPAGATGYFGTQTRAAVAAYQTAKNITPNAGYFGPITRQAVIADASGSMSTGMTPGCVAGAMFSTTTGAPCGTMSTVPGCAAGAAFSSTTGASCSSTSGTVQTGITTPGVEGILTVTPGPISNSVVNIGQTQVPVLTIRNQAQNSDIAIKRIQLDLGSSTNIYNKIYTNLYVVDSSTGTVLATVPLNSTNVVQSGNDYLVNLSNFNFVVPRNTQKDLIIKADLAGSVDSSYLGSYTITVPAQGVRGTDGAGVDQYGPITSFGQTIIVNRNLSDNAIANISLDPATPQNSQVSVTDTANGNYLQLPILTFDLNAQNDSIMIHNLGVNFIASGTGNVTAAYLYQGSTQVSSASITTTSTNGTIKAGSAVFSNITNGTAGATVPVNSTLPYTIKVDVTGVTSNNLQVTASTTSTGTTLYNSTQGTVTSSNQNGLNTTSGNTLTVVGAGPTFTLNSATLTSSGTTQTGNTTSTSTLAATFSLSIKATGENVFFGTQASTSQKLFSYKIVDGSGNDVTSNYVIKDASYQVPTGTGFITTGLPANTIELPISQSGTISNFGVSFQPVSSTQIGGRVGVQLTAFNYTDASGQHSATYPAGQTTYETNVVAVQ